MSDGNLHRTGEGFWNIRGSFRIAGLLDIGTQVSLVRRPSGRFLLLDSYALDDATLAAVRALTEGGAAVEAVLNLHPHHTVHCKATHEQFPQAKLYGSTRHKAKWPDLPWEGALVESEQVRDMFADTLELSVPRGVDYICSNDNVHFSSVLAYHPASGTLHVDDTLMFLDLPFPASLVAPSGRLAFHPTLSSALRKERGAADAFEEWAKSIAADWHECTTVCAAHSAVCDMPEKDFPERIGAALGKVRPKLDRHRRIYG